MAASGNRGNPLHDRDLSFFFPLLLWRENFEELMDAIVEQRVGVFFASSSLL